MWGRAIAIWLLLAALAVLNGGLRAAVIVPRAGERWGHVLSTLILCALILLVAWATLGWIGPSSASQAWGLGLLWLGLTLAFEFLAGRHVFRQPWERLLADYDVSRGRIWVLVLVVTLLAPRWAMRSRSELA